MTTTTAKAPPDGLVIKDVENEPFYMLTMSSARLGATPGEARAAQGGDEL